MSFNQLVGILPAIVFPTATLMQLVTLLRRRSGAGVHAGTWTLFGLANVAIYLYTERYLEWQAICGMLLTAVLDFAIVAVVLFIYPAARSGAGQPAHVTAAGTVTKE